MHRTTEAGSPARARIATDLFSSNMAARVVGVIVAGLAAIANFAWLPYYPVWATIVLAICIAVIWALTPTATTWPNRRVTSDPLTR